MKRKLVSYIGLVALVGAFIWTSYQVKRTEMHDSPIRPGKAESVVPAVERPARKANGFTLKALDGREVSLSDFSGKACVLLTFWVSGGANSRGVLPTLADWEKSYGPKGLAVVCINERESRDVVARFARTGRSPSLILLDEDGAVGDRYKAREMPTFVLVGKDGIILSAFKGLNAILSRQLEARICDALGVEIPAINMGMGEGKHEYERH